MKYTKRLTLNKAMPTSRRFALNEDGRFITDSKSGFGVPVGGNSDRPDWADGAIEGYIRYNTSTHDTEVYNMLGDGTGWEKIKTNRQTPITPQTLGIGNYENSVFGPLAYDVDTTKPQNILVFADNVYQIPTTNYTLALGTSINITSNVAVDQGPGNHDLTLDSVVDISPGQLVTAPSGEIRPGTTVYSVDAATKVIVLDDAITAGITSGTTLTFTFSTGTYVRFSSAVPNKPVFVLLGFDNYCPPND